MEFLERTESFGLVKAVKNEEGVELERGYIYLDNTVPLHTHVDEKGREYGEAYVLLSQNVDVRILILNSDEARKIETDVDLIKLLNKQKPMECGVAYICEPGEWHTIQRRSNDVPIVAYRKFYSFPVH